MARAQYRDAKSPSLCGIRREHCLHLEVSDPRWLAGPGQLIGAIHHQVVERTYHPGTTGAPTSAHRPFKGLGWTEVLTVPYYDLPGRICAFMFFGRNGRRPLDEVFKPVHLAVGNCEAGLAGLPSIDMADNPRDVIALSDYMLALRIQFRVFNVSMAPAPIVVWHDNGRIKTQHAWRAVGGKRVVFWMPEMDCKTLLQAVAVDGAVSTIGPTLQTPESVSNFLHHHPGTDVVREMIRHARPWDQALKSWLSSNESGKRNALFQQIEEAGADLAHIQQRIGVRRSHLVQPRTIRLGKHIVVEMNNTWRAGTTRGDIVEILDSVIRFTHVFKHQASDELCYHGELRHGGGTVPFTVPMNTFFHLPSLRKWLMSLRYEHGMPPVLLSRLWLQRLHDVALLFHQPVNVETPLAAWPPVVLPRKRQRKE